MIADINDMIFQRGEDGNLIAQEIRLEKLPSKPIIKVVPLTRGKLREIHMMSISSNFEDRNKTDNETIKNGLIEPKLTEQQIIDLKPNWTTAIVSAILSVSLGLSQEEVNKQSKELIEEQEEELKKK